IRGRDTDPTMTVMQSVEVSRAPDEQPLASREVVFDIDDLAVRYGSTTAFSGVTLDIFKNQTTAVIGPSGCGKSTFIRCLNRMHETVPQARVEGRVVIAELDVYGKGVSAVAVRRRVGMVFQKPNPFPTMNVYDNVAAGLRLNGVRNRRELDEVVERS